MIVIALNSNLLILSIAINDIIIKTNQNKKVLLLTIVIIQLIYN